MKDIKLVQPIEYYFQNDSQADNQVCIQYPNSIKVWEQISCRPVEQETQNGEQIYTCECQDLYPTTIVNDINNIFQKSNISKPFSNEGLESFSNFQFWKASIFYIFTTKTVFYIIFILYGHNLDLKDIKIKSTEKEQESKMKENNRLIEINSDITSPKSSFACSTARYPREITNSEVTTIIQSPIKKDPIIFPNTEDILRPKKSTKVRRKLVSQNRNKLKSMNLNNKQENSNTLNISSIEGSNDNQSPVKSQNQIILNQDIELTPPSQSLQGMTLTPQRSQITEIKEDDLENLGSQEIPDIKYSKSPESSPESIFSFQSDLTEKDKFNSRLVKQKNGKSEKNQDIKSIEPNENHSKTEKKYFTKDLFISIMKLHEFFSIFLIRTPGMSRPIGVTMYYIKIMTILSFTGLFSKSNSFYQTFLLGVLTGCLNTIPQKLLQIFLKSKLIPVKYIGTLLTISMIGFLYYVAMTAAALMKLEESNEWAKAYLLSFLCDFYLLQPLLSTGKVMTINKLVEGRLKRMKRFANCLLTWNDYTNQYFSDK